ncbi:matrixin family metalloprotease [Candidatus Pacearchaeota archaeon]|nr:matrixin family metalloprotease [Candidatus Pacearchaeota archaeon]
MEEEEQKPSNFRKFISFVLVIFVILLSLVYWFIPLNSIDFGIQSTSTNFSLNPEIQEEMQFYSKLRYPEKEISYHIMEDCTLQKRADMELAFEIIENKTILDFYESNPGEITVSCTSNNKVKGDFFIAGEGGPTNITKTSNFNVIFNGHILLIKDSTCPQPNVAIHELLHALGIDHSENKNNIMYNYSKCYQTIGQDTLDLIDELYSVEPRVDLALENVSVVMNGNYLDTNITIKNHGLKKSELTTLKIYADQKMVKEIEINPIEIGGGRMIVLTNNWISKTNFENLKYEIFYFEDELSSNNNVLFFNKVE